MKNPGRALEIVAKIGSAAASKTPKAASSPIPGVSFLSCYEWPLCWKNCVVVNKYDLIVIKMSASTLHPSAPLKRVTKNRESSEKKCNQ